jgi:predicted O-methyltransferase YrrM
MRAPTFRAAPDWRSRPVFGALGLRPAQAQHTQSEGSLLRRYAEGSHTVVEIGVAEGGSAWEVAQVLDESAHLHLVDPYFRRVMKNIVPARITAKRLVNSVARCQVTWHEAFSTELVNRWSGPIDLLFVDGDHSYEGVRQDWDDWTPYVPVGGHVALHDAHWDARHVKPEHGPAQLLLEVRDDLGWELADSADSLAILRRVLAD